MTRTNINNYALDISKNTISQGVVVDSKAINQSIENILMTGFNERVFEDYGSFLPTLVFTNITERSATEIMKAILKLIAKYETRISVVESLCSITIKQANHQMDLSIGYVIIASKTMGEFNKRIVF